MLMLPESNAGEEFLIMPPSVLAITAQNNAMPTPNDSSRRGR